MLQGRRWVAKSILLAAVAAFSSVALAQLTGIDQLGYKVTTFGHDANGLTPLQPGTIFILKSAGILGVMQSSPVTCAATVQNGVVHKPGLVCSTVVKDKSVFFQPGLKVYLEKTDFNPKKDRITFQLVACDLCNGTDPVSYYKTEVAFQFGKGEMATMTPDAVKAAVAKVLEIDPNGAVAPGAAQAPAAAAPAAPAAAEPAAPPAEPAAPAPIAPPPAPEPAEAAPAPIAPPPPPPAEPQTISVGQTVAQVESAFGKPEKIIKVSATKTIYMYKDLKVTFLNGKVSDVQ